ncbi:protein Hsh49p [Trichomonascus vanleenenianus]|uniref:SF3B4/SAP49 family RNA-binding protein n=1 Tax=Trichomonascus vanleenenianus TaxID=2268995 RepID=UPI003ECB9F27
MMNRPIKESERNQEATVYVGNLDERVTEALLYQLMIQAGPVVNIFMPRDRLQEEHQGYAFVEYRGEKDAGYAAAVLNQIKMFGKAIRVNRAAQDRERDQDVGARLFVGNLDPMVDEQVLSDTFSTFGALIETPTISRDSEGNSKGYGFVCFDSFEASDKALEAMNNQFLMNRPCKVDYALKKDGKKHGDEAERTLASQARQNNPAPSRPLISSTPTPAPSR